MVSGRAKRGPKPARSKNSSVPDGEADDVRRTGDDPKTAVFQHGHRGGFRGAIPFSQHDGLRRRGKHPHFTAEEAEARTRSGRCSGSRGGASGSAGFSTLPGPRSPAPHTFHASPSPGRARLASVHARPCPLRPLQAAAHGDVRSPHSLFCLLPHLLSQQEPEEPQRRACLLKCFPPPQPSEALLMRP